MDTILATIKGRLVLLGVSVTTALLLAMAWVGPAFADGDSDADSGVGILTPLVIVTAVVVPAYLYWRAPGGDSGVHGQGVMQRKRRKVTT